METESAAERKFKPERFWNSFPFMVLSEDSECACYSNDSKLKSTALFFSHVGKY